jgi:hypothetical protein
MPPEQIARVLGHTGSAVAERVYRHPLRPTLEDRHSVANRAQREKTRW